MMHHLIGSDWYYKTVEALNEIGCLRTYQVAMLLKCKTSQALRLLKVMESHDIVEKASFSYSNCYQWKIKKQKITGVDK